MPIVRWNPAISSMLNRWPDIWDEDQFSSLTTTASNNLDVYETENEVVVKANVAGIPEKDIDITFEKGVLLIRAEKTEEIQDEKKKYYSKSSWNYSYRVAVPGMIDQNAKPAATIKDGVITIVCKKSEASKPQKLTVTRAA